MLSKDVGLSSWYVSVIFNAFVSLSRGVKVLTGYNMDDPAIRESAIKELKREVGILSQLRHPHTVLYIGACTVLPKVCLYAVHLICVKIILG